MHMFITVSQIYSGAKVMSNLLQMQEFLPLKMVKMSHSCLKIILE